MKEKKIEKILDWLLWTFILILPLIATNQFVNEMMATFTEFMPGIEQSFIFTNITTLFSFLGITAGSKIYYLICWFIIIELTHLVIDVLLFIPRYFHKILDKGVKK